jgi:hypothetical protein
MKEDLIRIASFDPGKVNFSFYIEEMDKNKLLSIKNINTTLRYNSDGTCTEEMRKILDCVFENGKTILHRNLDLTKNCDKKVSLDPETYHNMNDALNEYIEEFNKCSIFIIEQQMSFGIGKSNPTAQKLGHHCYSFFNIEYGREKEVIEFPAYHKTQILGAPKVPGKKTIKGFRWKSMDKPSRKKWSVEKAIEILTSRGELDVLDSILTKRKKDDLADTLNQLQGYKYLRYVERDVK